MNALSLLAAPLELDTLAVRLAAAASLGGLLGLERELRRKPAGLRTHMVVALGAACFSLAALRLARGFAPALEQEMGASVDPTRIVQGIIGGIGFLGAGAIIQDRRSVEGLTTAAGIWLVGAVGVACGAGDYALAALVVAVALVVQVVVGKVERALVRPLRDREGDAE